ncbi:MAG: hypothetical protein P4L45_03015 [Ignavibacteriaceae bacterium]|nr:hypothetical protein [Ignavibacteriaceae bacterium]
MKGKVFRINELLLFFLFIVITFSGCGDQQVNSKWRTQDIKIDGDDSDWGNSLVFYDDINSLVGVQNDKDYLYLCLVTSDQQIERKIFMMGLTVWFDNTGKGDKKFGFKFPLVSKNMDKDAFKPGEEQGEGRRKDSDDGREGPGDNGRPGTPPPDRGKMGEMFLKNQIEIEVVDSKNEVTRVPITDMKGVELKMTVKNDRLVYELKIPIAMKSGFSYAIGANSSSTISIGLETAAMEMKKNKSAKDKSGEEGGGDESSGGEGMGGPGGGGGMGGPGGGGPGGRGPGGGQFNSNSFQPIKFWADIKLSTGAGN